MERVYAADVKAHVGQEIRVQGFVENLRNGAAMAFIVLKDISGKVQITVEKEKLPDLVPVIDTLTPDSVITVEGVVIENEYVKMGGIELIPKTETIRSETLPLYVFDCSMKRFR